MLTVNKLEKIIELEEQLRAEYEGKLEAAKAEAESSKRQLEEQREEMQATIDQQLQTIRDLSEQATANQQTEQRNRELSNRSENLQDEVTKQKQRIKTLQKDLASEREQVKQLTQFDPARMKKNLDANKKKLAEKTRANELLQKTLKEARGDKAELERKLAEVEEQLAKLQADLGVEEEAA